MDLTMFTHSQLHGALVEVLTEIEFHFAELRVIFSGTDYLDGELAMATVDAYNQFRSAYETLVRKSLNDLGVSNEQIDAYIAEAVKKLYDK